MHATALFHIAAILVATSAIFNWSEAAHVTPRHCIPCLNDYEDDCDDPPAEICAWGETRDACGRRVCGKGPGDRCGGHLGSCGEGMYCHTSYLEMNIARCHGCSVYGNMECYPRI